MQKTLLRREPITSFLSILRVLFSIVMLAFFAYFLTWLTYFLQYDQNLAAAEEFILSHQTIFWYSAAIIFTIEGVIAALLWRPFLAMAITFSTAIAISYANSEKLAVRGTPLLPEDFQFLNSADEMINFIKIDEVVSLIIGMICLIAGTIILEYALRRICRRLSPTPRWWERRSLLPRIAFFVISCTACLLLLNPLVNHRRPEDGNDNIQWLDNITFNEYDTIGSFNRNGFVISFIYNLGMHSNNAPEDYSYNTIANIYQKYSLDSPGSQSLFEAADNIIFILNESFYDPSILVDNLYGYYGGDVTPNLHRIMREHQGGYMYSSGYGGGTATVEFEAYTGLSAMWLNASPYVNSVSKISNFPSLVSQAHDQDFNTTAIHSFDGNFYKRNFVYHNMLFDTFIDEGKMTHRELENGKGYISDQAIYQEILDNLRDDSKNFIGAVTMQNHYPHDLARYDSLNFKLLYPQLVSLSFQMESYFETLHHSDQYLGEFIDSLNQLEEKTVVIWFGDHAGGVFSEYVNSENPTESDNVYLTPYFVYTNFEVDNLYTQDEVSTLNAERGFSYLAATGNRIMLPIVSANCITNSFYNILNLKKPAIQNLLDQICVESPIIAPAYYSHYGLQENQALIDYQLINFDILSGERYWLRQR